MVESIFQKKKINKLEDVKIIITENEVLTEKERPQKINVASISYGKFSSSLTCLIVSQRGGRGRKICE